MRCRAVSRTPQPTSVNLALFGHFTVVGADDEHGLGVRSLPTQSPPPACRVAYTSEGTPLRTTDAWPGGRLHLQEANTLLETQLALLSSPNRSGPTPPSLPRNGWSPPTSLCKTPSGAANSASLTSENLFVNATSTHTNSL